MSATSGTKVFAFAGYCLDPRRRLLFGPDGRSVPLNARAFDTLLYLVQHPNQVIDRQSLMTAVWPGLVVEDNNLNQTISAVRRALEETAGEHRFVITVPGRGFQFVPAVTRREANSSLDGSRDDQRTLIAPPILKPPGLENPAAPPLVVTGPAPRHRRPLNLWVLAAISALGLGIAAYLLPHSFLRHTTVVTPPTGAVAAPEPSIAVLPFVDMSEKKDQEYLADGLTEEILNLLTTIPELKVIGRASSFRYKNKAEDPRTIGAALGVSYLAAGSVRRSGDRVRVTVQLLDTRDGRQRWSQTYDRDATDVLQVQDEIAANLARGLQLAVAPSLLSQWRAVTRNAEAYDLYLRAQHAMYRFELSGYEEAIGYLRRALQLDPSFVGAAESLAVSLHDQSMASGDPRTGFQQARAAANEVLRLKPDSGTAHAVLGAVLVENDWAWPAAEREFKIATALAPKNPFVLLAAAGERQVVGDWTGALRLTEATLAVDPLDAYTYFGLSQLYVQLGRLPEAEAAIRHAMQISPTFGQAHSALAEVLLREGMPQAALAEAKLDSPHGEATPILVSIYRGLGRSREADATLSSLEKSRSPLWLLAGLYAEQGQHEKAIDLLEQSFARHEAGLCFVKAMRPFRNIANEPRFRMLLRRMNLPE
jgi:TolB-like protein/DNA-binding winged helix-turn-helix (wHTH) protein/Flp pilus assembly protein TadD